VRAKPVYDLNFSLILGQIDAKNIAKQLDEECVPWTQRTEDSVS